jgi:hypothetical protein
MKKCIKGKEGALAKTRHRWENNIEMDLKGIRCADVHCIRSGKSNDGSGELTDKPLVAYKRKIS